MPLTTIDILASEVGFQTAYLLYRLLQNEDDIPKKTLIPCLVVCLKAVSF